MDVGGIFILIGAFVVIMIIWGIKADASSKRKAMLKYQRYENDISHHLKVNNFHADKTYEEGLNLVWFDYKGKRGAILTKTVSKETTVYIKTVARIIAPASAIRFFQFDKITGCELVQDGTTVHQSAVLPGMIGAAAFGLGGALAGATAMHNAEAVGHISIRVYLDDSSMPSLTITVLNTSMQKSTQAYLNSFNAAQQLYTEFESIIRLNRKAQEEKPAAPEPREESAKPPKASDGLAENARILEQIKVLAKMRDEGILTDEEFADKKKLYMDKLA